MERGNVSQRLAPAGEPDWLTLDRPRSILGVAQSTIRKWSDQGACPPSTRPAATAATGAETSTPSSKRSGTERRRALGPGRPDRRRRRRAPPGVRPGQPRDGGLLRPRGRQRRRGARACSRGAARPDPARRDDADVDGWEMLRRVQERHGVGAIPVIMFSGQVDEQRPADAAREERRASSASRSTRSS